MKTIPAKVTERLVMELDDLVKQGWYASRSEAIRDAIRELVKKTKLDRLERAIQEDVRWGLYEEK
ncbi:MAG: ribbon-helix-helix domain-containing protein [Candidatus Heimdallarchaeota archaeon]